MIQEHNNSTWQGKAYSKIVDTTQQVTSFPVVVRPMENIIPSWTIKGNMQQTGTPTPQNPITPSECGGMTSNLFDKDTAPSVGWYCGSDDIIRSSTAIKATYIPCSANTTYTISKIQSARFKVAWTVNEPALGVTYYGLTNVSGTSVTVTTGSTAAYLYIEYYTSASDTYTEAEIRNTIMLNTGSTALPYQPYGYKLDIKSANTTTPVYLGEVESTRKIKKLVLTGQEDWLYNAQGQFFYIDTLVPDYLRAEGVITSICSHYKSVPQMTSGSGLNDGESSLYSGSTQLQRFYIKDTNYSDRISFANYIAAQYAAGTPVTVWYVLAAETTTTLNEPLRKIGTYSDSVSGTNLSVTAQSPTTIDVDTTLKPSEMDLIYTGLKMCKRKKRVNGAWV